MIHALRLLAVRSSVAASQGFYDRDANVRALTATAGNVNAVRPWFSRVPFAGASAQC